MELQGNVGFLSSVPPKLEDAGLEDCALPIEGVQEAFRIAAEKAKAAADSLKINLKGSDEDVGGCLSDPKPTIGDLKDAGIGLAGSTPDESCVETNTGGLLEEGTDAVVDPVGEPKEDKLVGGIDVQPKLGEYGCVGPVIGAEPSVTTDSADDGGDEEPKGPSLTEAYL
jgi:hypothetical protein